MEGNKTEPNHHHFPEDKDAPVIQTSFLKEFYEKNKNPFDYIIFGLITVITLFTVSFSIYIFIVKYF